MVIVFCPGKSIKNQGSKSIPLCLAKQWGRGLNGTLNPFILHLLGPKLLQI